MRTHGNIMEHITVGVDALGNTTVASTSKAYDMTDYDKALFIVGLGSAATAAPGRPVIDIVQSSNTTGAQTTISATVEMGGSTNATNVAAVRAFKVNISTAATNDEVVVINGTSFTMTTSTALLTASAASAKYFGSTIDCTNASGVDARILSLASMINNTTWGLGKICIAVTHSTSAILVETMDTASTYLTVQTTGGGITPWVHRAEYAVEVNADSLSTGQKMVACRVSSHAEGFNGKSVMCIRTGRRGGGIPNHHHGIYTKAS